MVLTLARRHPRRLGPSFVAARKAQRAAAARVSHAGVRVRASFPNLNPHLSLTSPLNFALALNLDQVGAQPCALRKRPGGRLRVGRLRMLSRLERCLLELPVLRGQSDRAGACSPFATLRDREVAARRDHEHFPRARCRVYGTDYLLKYRATVSYHTVVYFKSGINREWYQNSFKTEVVRTRCTPLPYPSALSALNSQLKIL